MKSIKLKLVLIYLALVFIVMLVSGTFMRTQIEQRETKKAVGDLRLQASYVRDQIIKVYPPEEFNDGFTKMTYASSQIHSYIIDTRYQTVGSSTKTMSESFTSSVIAKAFTGEGDSGRSKRNDGSQIRDWLELAEPYINADGVTEYVIFTRMDASYIDGTLLDVTKSIILMVILALVLTAIMGYLFANTLTGPIITLTKKAKELAHGNLNQEIPVAGKDEIGQLTESFNDMAKELNKTMSTMESEKNKMEIIQNNMTDGVLAYNTDGILIHANLSSQELLNVPSVEKVEYMEMKEILGFGSVDLLSAAPDSVNESTIALGDRYITALATPYMNKYGSAEGVIIVLQDITRYKKLDNMRKEFVANVSHELRTPLTTIKSYTETLIDGALDNRELAIDFLNTIDSEADRMTFLVRDLLELSRFDNKQLIMELKTVDLDVIIRQSIKQNLLMAEKRSQKIIYKDNGKPLPVECDEGRINQVITNIISNSIKYGQDGGAIEINTEETDKYYRVYIIDNGIGIPKADLQQIFERFYRVDKARSRAMGGTGLGLSIAKEIMEAHGGKITAISELDKGTTMILRFNKLTDYS